MVSYIKQQGGTRTQRLTRLAQQILGWTEKRIYLGGPYKKSLQHRGGLPQQTAHPPVEWELNSEVFLLVSQRFGRPEVYLFACRKNRKLQRLFYLARGEGFRGDGHISPEVGFGPGICISSLGTHPPGVTEAEPSRLQTNTNSTLVAKESVVPHTEEMVSRRPPATSVNQTGSPHTWTSFPSRFRVPLPDELVLEREILRERDVWKRRSRPSC